MKRLAGRTPLRPQNQKFRGKPLFNQHKFYSGIYRKTAEAALEVSGIYAIVYTQKRGGIKCTCIPSASLLTEEGNLTEGSIKQIEQKVQGVYGKTERTKFDARDMDLSLDRLNFNGKVHELNTELEEEEWYDTKGEPDLFDVDFGGFAQNRCGICLGSGYVGGYDVSKGHRIVLDTQARGIGNLDNIRIDTSEQPNVFRLNDKDKSGSLTIEHVVPVGREIEIDIFRIWNNDYPLDSNEWRLVNRDSKNRLIDEYDIYSDQGDDDDNIRTIELEIDNDFTHVEIQFSYGILYVDIPQPPDEFDTVLQGNYNTTSFNVSSEVFLNKLSVIRESKYNRAWQVNAPPTIHRNNKTLVYQEAEARLIAQHELFHLLVGPTRTANV